MMGTKYNNGKFQWTHGQVISYVPNRGLMVERQFLGPCPQCGSPTSNYGGSFSCHDDYCPNSASMFVCGPEKYPEWWDKGINVILDGNAWCATGPEFVNLQESNAGFGATPREAVAELLKAIEPVA